MKIDKRIFIDLEICIDNEYLDKYVELISLEGLDSRFNHSQGHHIIPRYYYNTSNLNIDDSMDNIVYLSFYNHILAHYYLYNCSANDLYKSKNTSAISLMLRKSNYTIENFISLKEELDKFYADAQRLRSCCNVMHDDFVRSKHDSKMRSDAVRKSISNTMKTKVSCGELFFDSHRKHLSDSASGLKHLIKDQKEIRTKDPHRIKELLASGWKFGSKPLTEEHQQALNKSHYKKVVCYSIQNEIIAQFDSVKDACYWWIDNGFVNKKANITKENYYRLADYIKLSSKNDMYICDVKWVYLDERRK